MNQSIKISLSGSKHLGIIRVEIATQVINSFMNYTKQKWKTLNYALVYLIFLNSRYGYLISIQFS